ncbi:MAG: YtxH domain-containing protein [Acidobacteria bacterium]|nr:YtxH domain-containing protein [Acidobacteriota bacterium]
MSEANGSFEEDAPLPEHRGGGLLTGVLIGALIGAGIALFFAPDKGYKTRRRFKRRIQALRKEVGEGWDDVKENAFRELLEQRKAAQGRLRRASRGGRGVLDKILG